MASTPQNVSRIRPRTAPGRMDYRDLLNAMQRPRLSEVDKARPERAEGDLEITLAQTFERVGGKTVKRERGA